MVGLIYIYKILSLGLAYPDEKNWELLEKQLELSADFFDGEVSEKLDSFKKDFFKNRHQMDHIQSEYISIFDVGRRISPYETEHITEKVSRKPFELADIAGFYTAFGFGVNENRRNKEALDHISVELEFMAILAWKEEYAKGKKQDENAEIVRDAQVKFLKDHLAKWGFFYCRQVNNLDEGDFFKKLAEILEFVLTLECEKYSLDISLFDREMRIDPFNGVRGEEFTC